MDHEQVQAGSYKGVPILFASGSVAGGNKNVVHSYPNSNRQTVENLGQTPRSFPVNLIIPSTSYVERRDALLAALEDGTPGPLVHPLYGRVENVVAGPYTLNEDMTELGDGKLTVTFYISNGPGIPQRAGTTVNTVARAKDAAVTSINANMAANYVVTPGFAGNFEAATAQVQDASLAFKQSQVPLDQASELLDAADTFAEEAAALILAPANMATRITGLMDQAAAVFDDPLDALAYYEGQFGFGDNGSAVPPVTAGQLEREQSTNVFNASMQAQSLGQAFLAAVQGEYETVDEVEAVNARLDAQFFKVTELPGLDDASKTLMGDIRAEAAAYFDEVKLTAKRVVEVQTKLTSARLLAFRYYGDSSRGEALARLNQLGDVNHVEGTVKVLTE